MLRTHQPRAKGIDALDRFGRSLLVWPGDLASDRLQAGFTESNIPRTGTTAENADTAHVLGLLVK